MKLAEIASRILVHLRRFEADPKINAVRAKYRLRPYYLVNAYVAGSKVGVCYVNYQGPVMLTKAEALAYLEWLDAGNVGTHWQQQRAADNPAG